MKKDSGQEIVDILRKRFEEYQLRHKNITWDQVEKKLKSLPDKIGILAKMESTGGEPDVIGLSPEGGFIFCDCSPESPAGRRSLCFDKKALDSRKQNKPSGSAVEMAASLGIELLDEDQYRYLQQLGEFDLKTSSWIKTPEQIRSLGGALFCDRRYDHVFVYHNGADSYYAARGFRGRLVV